MMGLVDLLGGEAVAGAFGGVDQGLAVLGDHIALHPGAGDVGIPGDIVFDLAGLDTEAAADALVDIDQKDPAHLALAILFGHAVFCGLNTSRALERMARPPAISIAFLAEFTAVHHDFTSAFWCFGFGLVRIMRVVTHDALLRGIMLLGVDARDFATTAFLVGQIGMAADTELPTAINVQSHRIFGVVILGAVAVFTADGRHGGSP